MKKYILQALAIVAMIGALNYKYNLISMTQEQEKTYQLLPIQEALPKKHCPLGKKFIEFLYRKTSLVGTIRVSDEYQEPASHIPTVKSVLDSHMVYNEPKTFVAGLPFEKGNEPAINDQTHVFLTDMRGNQPNIPGGGQVLVPHIPIEGHPGDRVVYFGFSDPLTLVIGSSLSYSEPKKPNAYKWDIPSLFSTRRFLLHNNPAQCELMRAFEMALKQKGRIQATPQQWQTFLTLPKNIQNALKLYIRKAK